MTSNSDSIPTPRAEGNLGGGLDDLLNSFGLVRVATRDTAEEIVAAELTKRHHEAEVISLRYGTLLLAARPIAAELLNYDRDHLHSALEAALPGVIRRLRIRVTR